MLLSNPMRGYEIACCVLQAARNLFDAYDVPWFARAGVLPYEGDWECENCSALFVYLDGSEPVFGSNGKCETEREHTYIVTTARCVGETNPATRCDPDWYGGCLPSQGCPDHTIVPQLVEPCKRDGNGMPVAVKPAETAAFLWRDRQILEYGLGDAVSCCVRDCVGLRCDSVSVESVDQSTEGGCHFVSYRLTVVY